MAKELLHITDKLSISASEIRFRFTRGGGPGGQHVNKVETRVELLFDVTRSSSLSDEQRTKILRHLRSRLDSEGILRVVSQDSRSQWKNRETAVRRFIELIRKALTPRKKRVKTRMPESAKQRRLDMKRRRSDVKKLRGRKFVVD